MRLLVGMATKSLTITAFIDDLNGGKADRSISFAAKARPTKSISPRRTRCIQQSAQAVRGAARKVRRLPHQSCYAQ